MCGWTLGGYALTTILCLHSESILMVINNLRLHAPSDFLSMLVSRLVVNYKQLPEKDMYGHSFYLSHGVAIQIFSETHVFQGQKSIEGIHTDKRK